MMEHEIHEKIAKLTARKSHLLMKLGRVDDQLFELYDELDEGRSIHHDGPGLYVIKSAGYYKIGFASDLKSRLVSLKIGNPTRLRVVIFIPCTIKIAEKLEVQLHKTFSNKHLQGEWFKLSSADLKHIVLLSHKYSDSYPIQNLFDSAKIGQLVKKGYVGHVDSDPNRAAILNIILERQTVSKAPVSINAVIEEAEWVGIDRGITSEIIQRMCRDGDVFQPLPEMIKLP
jgi:hypothetical protein